MPYNGIYLPEKQDLYKLSRSKVDFFLNCPRCFYMDRRLGISQPPGFPFNLNSAVDNLLKNEFDYFESNPPVKDLKVLDYPTKDEEKCVVEFYKKYIIDRKDQKTDTVIISN